MTMHSPYVMRSRIHSIGFLPRDKMFKFTSNFVTITFILLTISEAEGCPTKCMCINFQVTCRNTAIHPGILMLISRTVTTIDLRTCTLMTGSVNYLNSFPLLQNLNIKGVSCEYIHEEIVNSTISNIEHDCPGITQDSRVSASEVVTDRPTRASDDSSTMEMTTTTRIESASTALINNTPTSGEVRGDGNNSRILLAGSLSALCFLIAIGIIVGVYKSVTVFADNVRREPIRQRIRRLLSWKCAFIHGQKARLRKRCTRSLRTYAYRQPLLDLCHTRLRY